MIRVAVKRLVRSVYVMRCGYCLLSETETGAELTFDHFQPQIKGGSDDADNLVFNITSTSTKEIRKVCDVF